VDRSIVQGPNLEPTPDIDVGIEKAIEPEEH